MVPTQIDALSALVREAAVFHHYESGQSKVDCGPSLMVKVELDADVFSDMTEPEILNFVREQFSETKGGHCEIQRNAGRIQVTLLSEQRLNDIVELIAPDLKAYIYEFGLLRGDDNPSVPDKEKSVQLTVKFDAELLTHVPPSYMYAIVVSAYPDYDWGIYNVVIADDGVYTVLFSTSFWNEVLDELCQGYDEYRLEDGMNKSVVYH